jgi:hypothetical protein
MTFEEELHALIANAREEKLTHAQLEIAVAELHRKHGRKVPPPITGTMNLTEPDDSFGKK